MIVSPRSRFGLWIACVVALLVGQPVWFFLLRGPRVLDNDRALFAGWQLFSVVVLLLWLLLHSTPPNAIVLRRATSNRIITAGTIWLHMVAVALLWPGLSEDALRYRRDGLLWLNSLSPYRYTEIPTATEPYTKESEFKTATLNVSTVRPDWMDLQAMPFKQMNTIYLPTSQIVFILLRKVEEQLHLIAGQSAGEYSSANLPTKLNGTEHDAELRWREVLPQLVWWETLPLWRAAFGVLMIGTTLILLRALSLWEASPWWAVLFGWHPLAIVETSGMAHQDAIGLILLAAAVLAYVKLELKPVTVARTKAGWLPFKWRPWQSAGVFLGLAAGVKPLALIVAPFWLIGRSHNLPSHSQKMFPLRFCLDRQRFLLFVLTTLVLLVLSTGIIYQNGYVGFLQQMENYTQNWEANGSIYHLLRTNLTEWKTDELIIWPAVQARIVGASVGAGVVLWLIVCGSHWTTGFYFTALTALLVSPVVYPWYLLWPLLVLPLLRGYGLTLLVFCGTVVLNYHLWRTPDWVLPTHWLLIEYIPVYVALAVEVIVAVRNTLRRPERDPHI